MPTNFCHWNMANTCDIPTTANKSMQAMCMAWTCDFVYPDMSGDASSPCLQLHHAKHALTRANML